MKIHHIGYLVEDINDAIINFKELGYVVEKDIVHDKLRNVYISFLQNNGYRVELIQPIDKSSGLYKLLRKNGNMPYYICYETEKIEDSINLLKEKGYFVIQQIELAPAIYNRKVAFLMNANIGMIELLEIKRMNYV